MLGIWEAFYECVYPLLKVAMSLLQETTHRQVPLGKFVLCGFVFLCVYVCVCG